MAQRVFRQRLRMGGDVTEDHLASPALRACAGAFDGLSVAQSQALPRRRRVVVGGGA